MSGLTRQKSDGQLTRRRPARFTGRLPAGAAHCRLQDRATRASRTVGSLALDSGAGRGHGTELRRSGQGCSPAVVAQSSKPPHLRPALTASFLVQQEGTGSFYSLPRFSLDVSVYPLAHSLPLWHPGPCRLAGALPLSSPLLPGGDLQEADLEGLSLPEELRAPLASALPAFAQSPARAQESLASGAVGWTQVQTPRSRTLLSVSSLPWDGASCPPAGAAGWM